MDTRKITEYLHITKAAMFLGVTQNTLRNWGNRKLIKEYRNPMNDYRLYKIEDLEEILNNIKQNNIEG